MQQTKFSPDDRLIRISQVVDILGISRSTFYAGIKRGIFPAPLKISSRTSVWPHSQIRAVAENLTTLQ
jgi:prophage regulatory protein